MTILYSYKKRDCNVIFQSLSYGKCEGEVDYVACLGSLAIYRAPALSN